MPSLQKLSSASVDRRSPRDKGTWLPSQRPPSQRPPPDGPQQRRPGPSLALQRQQRQQLEHQQQLQQQLYRQQRLRVPYWVRSLASEFLQVMVPAGAAASAAGPAGAFAEPPAEVMQRLAALLPPYQESREQAARRLKQQQADAAAAVEERQQQAAAAADEQQQAATLDNLQEEQAGEQGRQGKENRQQVQQQAEQHLPPPPQQQQAPAAARGSGAGAGSVFAAELAQILRHYEESSAVAAPEGAAPDPQPAPAAAGSCAKQRRTAMGPFATPATPVSGRGRHLDEGGFVLLLRAVALMVREERERGGKVEPLAMRAAVLWLATASVALIRRTLPLQSRRATASGVGWRCCLPPTARPAPTPRARPPPLAPCCAWPTL